MTESLDRIVQYFEEFRQKVAICRTAESFKSVEWKDAYGAFGRLRDRYDHEEKSRSLSPTERESLKKVFEDDAFIRGIMELRQVAEHVITRRPVGPLLYTTAREPVQLLTVESSALATFAAPIVPVHDANGKPYTIEHLKMLEEAERCVAAAIARAKQPARSR